MQNGTPSVTALINEKCGWKFPSLMSDFGTAQELRCPNHKKTDFVMALPDGSLPSGYDSGVGRLLKKAELLVDRRE